MRRIRKTGKQETFIRIVLFICVPAFLIFFSGSLRAAPVVIGSKKFTESYVLGEIAKRSLIDAGISVEHRQGMGGTIILWEALRSGQIDVYPEYTGTITQEILKRGDQLTFEQIASELGKIGIGMTEPLGFNNTYALVMLRSRAQKLGLRTVSDLRVGRVRVFDVDRSVRERGVTKRVIDSDEAVRIQLVLLRQRSPAILSIQKFVSQPKLQFRMVPKIADCAKTELLGTASRHHERVGIVEAERVGHSDPNFA